MVVRTADPLLKFNSLGIMIEKSAGFEGFYCNFFRILPELNH